LATEQDHHQKKKDLTPKLKQLIFPLYYESIVD
jgi:hypothetical protein